MIDYQNNTLPGSLVQAHCNSIDVKCHNGSSLDGGLLNEIRVLTVKYEFYHYQKMKPTDVCF